MSHEIATKDGQHSTFHVAREGAPWHQLGVALDEPATAAEAIRQIHADFDVIGLPLYAHGAPGGPIEVPSHVLNVRGDDFRPLGVVSPSYKVIQNRSAFSFLDAVAGDSELRYHTAGMLGDGERIWMLARLTGDIRVGRTDDVIERYLLLFNSHDGSSALRCLWSPIRVVCANTVSAALRQGEGTGITIRHTGEITRKVEEAQRVLGLASKFFKAFGEGADLLAGHTPTKAQLDTYFATLYPDPEKGDAAKAKATRMTLWGLFEQGMGQDMPGIKGTSWAALQAVTELVDHHVGTDMRRRLESSWWGDGQKVKIRAFDEAIKMATATAAN
jgi:phage/plasmid-like protein (TIGR03299 family)